MWEISFTFSCQMIYFVVIVFNVWKFDDHSCFFITFIVLIYSLSSLSLFKMNPPCNYPIYEYFQSQQWSNTHFIKSFRFYSVYTAYLSYLNPLLPLPLPQNCTSLNVCASYFFFANITHEETPLYFYINLKF